MPLESATTNSIRANPRTECNNATCPAAGEITIRQPHVNIPKSLEVFIVDKTALTSDQHLSVRLKMMSRSMLPIENIVTTDYVFFPETVSDVLADFEFFKSKVVPIGTILAFAGETKTIPDGWLLCNGDLIQRTAYPELFAAIGAAWGHSSSNDFNLPDLRGTFYEV
jgi:hypothetical protein